MSSALALPPAMTAAPAFSLALPPAIARKQSASASAAAATAAAATAATTPATASTATVPAPAAAGQNNPVLASVNAQAGPSKPAAARAPGTQSPAPAEAEEEDGSDAEDDDDAGGPGSKKKAGGKKGKKAAEETPGVKEYKYSTEISQMMFVFGEVQDPSLETVKLVEDIVRGQIIELVTRARLMSHMRNSRYLSPEDVIFLIRDDRGKVNRLRTYQSWKEVRKRAKEDEGADNAAAAGGSGGPGGPGGAADDGDPAEAVGGDMDKAALKGRKMAKLPWERLTPFSEFLRSTAKRDGREDEEDEDEDEMQAYQDSMQRLRDADEITKKMTKDEYVHYSDCRQASFTYRKARRFRNFVNFSAYLEARPNDDIVDVLGFLAFEMVRSLCVAALDVRDRLEKTTPVDQITDVASMITATAGIAHLRAAQNSSAALATPEKRKSSAMVPPNGTPASGSFLGPSPSKRAKADSPEEMNGGGGSDVQDAQQPQQRNKAPHPKAPQRKAQQPIPLFAPPPSARQPLLPAHVLEAYAQIQRAQARGRGGGVRNFRGGMKRPRLALV